MSNHLTPKTKSEARWQDHYDDYCFNNFGGREPGGREHDEASTYADSMMEEENDE